MSKGADRLTISYEDEDGPGDGANIELLSHDLDYQYRPCGSFEVTFGLRLNTYGEGARYVRIRMFVVNLGSGKTFELHIPRVPHRIVMVGWRPLRIATFSGVYLNGSWWDPPITVYSACVFNYDMNGLDVTEGEFASIVFSEKGRYRLMVKLEIVDSSIKPSRVTIEMSKVEFSIRGEMFGILGTNHHGQDVWSQFVWGSRVSLVVGLLAALIMVCIGLVVGLVAGYKGGVVDQALMFITDVVLLMPTLPLILVTIMILKEPNIFAIIGILAVFGWPGLARQVRAWTMSLKERLFVEAAKAIGCPHRRIMFRHVLPQLVPITIYALVMGIPGAILTEAGISILGLGSPFVPSWGKMIHEAWHFGGISPARIAWWWALPPIAGIFLLCTAFVSLGFALDEILNPRLRAR